jgi:hypothetical protein
MMVVLICLTLLTSPDQVPASRSLQVNRPQKYALYRAHKILPPTLSKLIKLNGKFLFMGFDKAAGLPQSRITPDLIITENHKITKLVNQQAPFSRVVMQMGYVGGLLSVYLNPALSGPGNVQKGFPFYMNKKVPKFLFVFDGYKSMNKIHGNMKNYLENFGIFRHEQTRVLALKYAATGNPYHVFSEQSAVFGISSVYFSNLASSSAHAWYEAWRKARGDTKRTPYLEVQTTPIKKRGRLK